MLKYLLVGLFFLSLVGLGSVFGTSDSLPSQPSLTELRWAQFKDLFQ